MVEAIKLICDPIVASAKQGMNEALPLTINKHKVEKLGVLATNDGYEHVPSSKANEQRIGDQMCEMALIITFPFQHFVEPNELEHNGDHKENEQSCAKETW